MARPTTRKSETGVPETTAGTNLVFVFTVDTDRNFKPKAHGRFHGLQVKGRGPRSYSITKAPRPYEDAPDDVADDVADDDAVTEVVAIETHLALDPAIPDASAALSALKEQVAALFERSLGQWQRAQHSEQAITALLANLDEPPSETTMRGLLAHDAAWRDLDHTWGAWSSAHVAEVVGKNNRNPHDWANAQARSGKLLAVERANRLVFPGYQFDRATGTPAKAMPMILEVFRGSGWGDDSIALWFTSPQGAADGAVPAEILHSEPDKVVAAARITASG